MLDKNNFVVIELNTKQYLVGLQDELKVDRVNEKSALNILLSNVGGELVIGEPYVTDVGVKLEVIENKKDKKISVRRFKSKSRYRKNKGHRQPISMVKVKEIAKGIKNELILSNQLQTTKMKNDKSKKV